MFLKPWTRVLIVGFAYAVVGIGFTELSKRFATDQVRAWRLAAWMVSAVIYGAHFLVERSKVERRAVEVALQLTLAVALGAFLLALAAGVHAMFVVSHAPFWLYAVALIAWPIFTGVPAFIVALITSAAVMKLKASIPNA